MKYNHLLPYVAQHINLYIIKIKKKNWKTKFNLSSGLLVKFWECPWSGHIFCDRGFCVGLKNSLFRLNCYFVTLYYFIYLESINYVALYHLSHFLLFNLIIEKVFLFVLVIFSDTKLIYKSIYFIWSFSSIIEMKHNVNYLYIYKSYFFPLTIASISCILGDQVGKGRLFYR